MFKINGGRGFSMGGRQHQPLMGPMAYKTFTLRPKMRRATCAEIDCVHWRDGWTFPLAELLKDKQLLYMARHSGKRYTERVENGETYLVYAPGQPCFAAALHKVPIEEAIPLLFAGRGDPRTFDKRGLPKDARQHTRVDDWVDEFATHQQKLSDEIDKG